MKYIFYHLFYRTYYWNIKVIKEKDLPILSAYLFVSVLIGINIITIYSTFLVFIIKDPQLYPEWGYWVVIFLTFVPNYFIFIHKKNYKTILNVSQNMNKTEKRKKDIAILIYILLTFLTGIYVVNASRNLLFQQGVIIN